MLRVVVLGALISIACGQTTPVNQCTMNGGELPVNAYIDGCDALPCGLPQKENVIINIIFKPSRTIPTMTTVATAYLSVLGLPVPVPYPLGENSVTCNFLTNSYCPVLANEVIAYQLHMFIEETFPVGIAPTIEFRINDDNGVPIVCIRVPIVIQSPRSRHAARNATLAHDDN